MFSMLLAGALAVTPAPSVGTPASDLLTPGVAQVRIPGTRLHLGQPLAQIDSTGVYRPRKDAGVASTRGGESRFFGLLAHTSLWFESGRLARVLFEIDSLSSHSADYVQDGLRRLGYRARCEVLDPSRSECEWSGASRIVIKREERRLSADVTPAPPARAVTESATTAPADTTPAAAPELWVPDTLAIGRTTGRYPAPEYAMPGASGPSPHYPDLARAASVQGVVRVLTLVDTTGAVIEASVVRSIPMLDAAALDAVHVSRFRPYVFEGRLRRFRVIVPVMFTLH